MQYTLTTQRTATARHFAIEDKGRHTRPRAQLPVAAREALYVVTLTLSYCPRELYKRGFRIPEGRPTANPLDIKLFTSEQNLKFGTGDNTGHRQDRAVVTVACSSVLRLQPTWHSNSWPTRSNKPPRRTQRFRRRLFSLFFGGEDFVVAAAGSRKDFCETGDLSLRGNARYLELLQY